MSAPKLPRSHHARLAAVAKQHGFASADAFGHHLVERGLRAYGVPAGEPLAAALARVVDDQGYSSEAELLEHLLERGLRAYEDPAADRGELEKRLRGLGYID